MASPLPESSSSSVSTAPPPPPPPLRPESRAQLSSSSPHSERGLQKIKARFGVVVVVAAAVLSTLPESSHAAWPAATASARKAARASAGRRPVSSFVFRFYFVRVGVFLASLILLLKDNTALTIDLLAGEEWAVVGRREHEDLVFCFLEKRKKRLRSQGVEAFSTLLSPLSPFSSLSL